MQDVLINNIKIVLIACYVIDVSGFVQDFKKKLFFLLHKKGVPFVTFSIKPFDCSACVTFWFSLAYNLTTCNILDSFFIASLFSYISQFFTKALFYLKYKIM